MTAADSGGEPPSLSPDCPLHSAGSSSEKRTGMVYLDALAEPRHSANHQPVIGDRRAGVLMPSDLVGHAL
jgi:hypothetical protein